MQGPRSGRRILCCPHCRAILSNISTCQVRPRSSTSSLTPQTGPCLHLGPHLMQNTAVAPFTEMRMPAFLVSWKFWGGKTTLRSLLISFGIHLLPPSSQAAQRQKQPAQAATSYPAPLLAPHRPMVRWRGNNIEFKTSCQGQKLPGSKLRRWLFLSSKFHWRCWIKGRSPCGGRVIPSPCWHANACGSI